MPTQQQLPSQSTITITITTTTSTTAVCLIMCLFAHHQQLTPVQRTHVAADLLQLQASQSCLPSQLTYITERRRP
jgi:hypothetical protein